MLERRKVPRWKTFYGACAAFSHRQSTMDCLLKNMSRRGGKLVFPSPIMLPEEFDLKVARLGRAFQVRVAWHTNQEVGVIFIERPESADVIPLDYALRIRKLEAEKAKLSSRIVELSTGE